MKIRTYSELMSIPTFMERFEYLRLNSRVGGETFGYDRYLNQRFYQSYEWRSIRNKIILRDNGCDLGIPGREITGSKIFIHHMNPLDLDDILEHSEYLANPEYLITVSFSTHNALHYGTKDLLIPDYIGRSPNDTCPWKQHKEN